MLSNDNGFLNLHHYVIRIQTWDSTLVHNNAHINLDIDTSINIVILASIDVSECNIKQYQMCQTDHKWLLLMMMRMIIAEIYSDFDYCALLSD